MISLLLLQLFVSGCGIKENEDNQKQTTTITSSGESDELTEEQKNAIENGYQVDEYTIYLTEGNKESHQDIDMFVENDFYKKNILQVKGGIDKKIKINILTYAMNYSPEEERYTLGLFFINTSHETINELKMSIRPIFKNISESGGFLDVHLKGKNFVELPMNGMIAISFSADVPIESLDQLKQNKGRDITFEIKDLEINGEKVNNSNQ